jgi:hypothetical protein
LKVRIQLLRLEYLSIIILDLFNANKILPSPSPALIDAEQQSQGRPITHISTPSEPPPINYSTHPCHGKSPPPLNRSTHPCPPIPSEHEPSDHPQKRAGENQKEESVSGWEEYDVLDIAQAEYDGYLRRLIRMEKRIENLPRRSVMLPDASIALARLDLERSARVLEQMKDYRVALDNEQYELEMMRGWGY